MQSAIKVYRFDRERPQISVPHSSYFLRTRLSQGMPPARSNSARRSYFESRQHHLGRCRFHCNSRYSFQCKARNAESNETGYCAVTGRYTLINAPTGITFNADSNSMGLTAQGTPLKVYLPIVVR